MAEGPTTSPDARITSGICATEWKQAFDFFNSVREKSIEERAIFLDAACGIDTPVRKAVENLLKQDEDATGFLSQPLFGLSRAAPVTISNGKRFGRYIIESPLGRGGMGEVWSAYDPDLDRQVALKFLSQEALLVVDAEQITSEAKSASALNHPNIVTIHEIVRSESILAIVMEVVEGAPLREAIATSRSIAEVIAIGCQIAEALTVAHRKGIIHGDIKPENILLRSDGYIKLLDFGLARKISSAMAGSGGSPTLGTLRYVSPEQACGDLLTPATDVFSFGLVLYELATGRHPFPAGSPIQTAQAILTKEPRAPSSINPATPASLDSIIRSMLAKEARARPSAQRVTEALKDLQQSVRAHHGFDITSWKTYTAAILFGLLCSAAWIWIRATTAQRSPIFRQVTTLVPENRATAAAISPNGKLAAYANVDGIFIREMETTNIRQVSAPPDLTVDRIAWFADGSNLAVSGFSNQTDTPSVWIVSLSGAAPRFLFQHARGASPSPDGTHVAFVSADGAEVWVIDVNGRNAHRLVAGRFGEDEFPIVLWSADGRRLTVHRRHLSPGHSGRYAVLDPDHVWTDETVELATGKIVSTVPGELMSSAASLPDGRILFLRWDANFMSAHEVWEIKTDAATGKFLGPARKGATLLVSNDETLAALSATNDGKRIMVLRQSDQNTVFVGDFDPTLPRINNVRRLTLDDRTNYPHAWTADSQAVIFESNRNGSFDLFKQQVDRRTPEVIVATAATEMLPQLAPDGHTLLYAIRPDDRTPQVYKLMRVDVKGGSPEEVPIGGALDEFRCALKTGNRCVLRVTKRGAYYAYFDLDPFRGKGKELARTRWSPGILGDWDISPDGTEIAIPNHDSAGATIRVVSLQPNSHEPREKEVTLPDITNLHGLVWSADPGAWFVSMETPVGHRLLYADRKGRFRTLGDIQGWAVPSPDGRRLAFQDRIIATNAWLIERR